MQPMYVVLIDANAVGMATGIMFWKSSADFIVMFSLQNITSPPPPAHIHTPQDSRVYVIMRNGTLEVGIKRGEGAATLLRSGGGVAIREWHYLLIDFNSQSDG